MSGEEWTTGNIPDQSGRVAVVTGANSGLGLEATRALARHRTSVVLAVRNLDRGKAAIDDIRASWPAADLHLQQLDLASLDSVCTATDEMRERYDRIDLLMNNAGAMYTQQDRPTRRNRCGPTRPTGAVAGPLDPRSPSGAVTNLERRTSTDGVEDS